MTDNLRRFGSAGDTRRSEDGPLLTGRGRFTDDVDVPGQAHAAFVRARIEGRRVIAEMEAPTPMRLLHTVEDYLACVAVAEEAVAAVRS